MTLVLHVFLGLLLVEDGLSLIGAILRILSPEITKPVLLDDGILELLVETNVDETGLVRVGVSHGELLVGERVREHDAASVLADEISLADLILEVDHEQRHEAHDGIGQEPSAADGMSSTIGLDGAHGVVLVVNLDGNFPDESNGSGSTEHGGESKEVAKELFLELVSEVLRTNLGVVEDDGPEDGVLLSLG